MKIVLFNKKTDSTSILKGFIGGNFVKLGVAMLLLLTGAYVFQVSEMTKDTYAIQNYNAEIRIAMEESRNREYSFLRSNSLSRVEMLMEGSDFERVNGIHYIEISETQIASR